jgi:hypothetical protein
MHLLIESTKSMKTKEFFLAFCDAPSIFILLLGPHTLVALYQPFVCLPLQDGRGWMVTYAPILVMVGMAKALEMERNWILLHLSYQLDTLCLGRYLLKHNLGYFISYKLAFLRG